MTDLTGKRALVTGGSRGIGAAIALALAEKGADVAISYERAADRAQQIVDEIKSKGRQGVAIQADAAAPDAVRRMVDTAADRLGGLDILVNIAAVVLFVASPAASFVTGSVITADGGFNA